MSDKIHTIVVTLEKDVRDDEAEPLMEAVRHLKGVLTVKGEISDFASNMAEDRARHKFLKKLIDAAQEPLS